jgi:branched-chain amino acid transport system substrate-binding protein
MSKPAVCEKITAGISISLSGKFRLQGIEALRGVELWAAYLNHNGGIYLRERARSLPIEIIAYDDLSKKDRAKDNVVRLLKEDGVDLLFGPYSSHLTMAVAPITESQKKILWNHGGASDAICRQDRRYLVSVLSPASSYLRSLPSYLTMREPSLRRLLCLTASSGTFAAHVAQGLEEAAESCGLAVVRFPFASPIADIGKIIQTTQRVSHDLLVVIGSFEDDIKIVRHSSGTRPIITVAAGSTAFGRSLGVMAEGVIGPSQWEAGLRSSLLNGPGPDWFSAHFKKEFGMTPDYTAAQGFATGVVIQEAIRRAGGLDDERLRKTVAHLDIHTFYGAFRIEPKSGCQIGHQILLVRWQRGEKVVIWPSEAI